MTDRGDGIKKHDVDDVEARPSTIGNDLPIRHEQGTRQCECEHPTPDYPFRQIVTYTVSLIQQDGEAERKQTNKLRPIVRVLARRVVDAGELVREARER